MPLIFNPGSGIVGGTKEEALNHANWWLKHFRLLFPEVELIDEDIISSDGYYVFKYKHGVTGKVVEFLTHGYTDEECDRMFMFRPREYMAGSSTVSYDNPTLWVTDEFEYVYTFKKKGGVNESGQ